MQDCTLTYEMFSAYPQLINFLDENDPSNQNDMLDKLQESYSIHRKSGHNSCVSMVPMMSICAALGRRTHLELVFLKNHAGDYQDALIHAISNRNIENIQYCITRHGYKTLRIEYVMKYVVAFGSPELFDDLYKKIQCSPRTAQELATIALAYGQWSIFNKLATPEMDFRTEMKGANEFFSENTLLSTIISFRNDYVTARIALDEYQSADPVCWIKLGFTDPPKHDAYYTFT